MKPNLVKDNSKKSIIDLFAVFLIFAFFIRLAIGIGYYNEQDTLWYQQWALSLPDGLFNVYARADAIDLDYPPIYLFFLYILGWIFRFVGADCHKYVLMFLMKLWPILADMLCAIALFSVFKKSSAKTGLVAAALWLFNPSVLFNSSFWGQTDQLMCLLLMISFVSLERDKPLLACFLFAIAGMTKYQCLFFTPVFLTELFVKYRVSAFLKGILTAAGTVAAVFLPFMIGSKNLLLFFDVYLKGQGRYPHCTLNAYNIYGMFGLNWIEDSKTIIGGLSLYVLSMFFVVLAVLAVIAIYLLAYRRSVWVIGFWFMNTLFMFMTRMHERYQFVALIFILMAALTLKNRGFFYGFLGLSFITFINQAIPMFSWNSKNSLFSAYYGDFMFIFSFINVALYFITSYICFKFLFTKEEDETDCVLKKGV